MATHYNILTCLSWTEEPGGYSPWACKQSDVTEGLTHTHTQFSYKIEGNCHL